MKTLELEYMQAMQQTDAAIKAYYNKRIIQTKPKLNLIQVLIKRIKKA
jgi:hypothetical protein